MSQNKSGLASIGILVSLLTLSMPSTAQDGQLSASDIQTGWIGKTVQGTIASGPAAGKPLEFIMNADGTATVSGAATDTGTWRLSDKGYCATWKKIRNGQERCFTVLRKGSEHHVINPDGTTSTVVTQIR